MILFKALIVIGCYMLMWTVAVLLLLDLWKGFCQTRKLRIWAKYAKEVEQSKIDPNPTSIERGTP